MTPEILLVGPGAVGVYFCGRLAQAGARVSVMARSNRDLIESNGYEVESVHGNFHFTPAGVYRDGQEYPGLPDWIIVATKVLPGIDLPGLLAGAVRSPKTRILLIQNGIFIEEAVAAAFPDNPLYSAVAYIGVSRTAAGRIRHQDGGRLTFGRYGDLPPEREARELCELFRRTPVETGLTDDISVHRWRKLLWNVPFNSISVAAGKLDTREIVANPDLEQLCRQLMREVVLAAAAAGVGLTERMCEENMEYTRNFAPYKTSMLLDYEAGRPMEVEAIVGNLVHFAQGKSLSLPHLETILALLRALNSS